MSSTEYERLINKLHKLAYVLEYDAVRLNGAGKTSEAGTVKAASSMLGNLVRSSKG